MQKSLLLQNWKKEQEKQAMIRDSLNYFMKSDTEAGVFIRFSLKKPLEKLGKLKLELSERRLKATPKRSASHLLHLMGKKGKTTKWKTGNDGGGVKAVVTALTHKAAQFSHSHSFH